MSINKKNNKDIIVNDKQYWKNRHAQQADLRAFGLKSVGLKANKYIYKILADQYLKLLNSLDLTEVKSVLDGGFGDGYFLKFYQNHFPHLGVYGVDISKDAKAKIDKYISENSHSSTQEFLASHYIRVYSKGNK